MIISDNGTELTSNAVLAWSGDAASSGTISRRASPTQNRFVESFNGRMRDELLNETLFFTIGQARSILARWVDDYDTERPHFSFGYATLAAFAAGLERQRADLPRPLIHLRSCATTPVSLWLRWMKGGGHVTIDSLICDV